MSETDSRVPDMRKREALLIHIEGLQVSLTKRNQRITELEGLITGEGQSAFMSQRLASEYKRGWETCANQLSAITHEAARNLGQIRKDALSVYFHTTESAGQAGEEANND